MKHTKTKSALLLSALSLLLCCAMLIGTTFAWFTDTATASANKIQAGNLKVDLLLRGDNGYASIKNSTAAIFNTADNANGTNATLWEPGATHVAYLAVQNQGNLALKYNIIVDVTDGGLAPALQYVIVPQGKTAPTSDISGWDAVKTGAVTLQNGRMTAAQQGCLDEITGGTQNETDYFALVVHMDENAGNEYQDKNVIIDVNIVATQKDAESDSFTNTYDENAELPTVAKVVHETVSYSGNFKQAVSGGSSQEEQQVTAIETIKLADDTTLIPKDTKLFTAKDKEDVPITTTVESAVTGEITSNIQTTNMTSESVTFQISYTYKEKDKEAVSVSKFSEVVTNEFTVATGLNNVKVFTTHNGGDETELTSVATKPTKPVDGTFYYDSTAGKLYIYSSTYSDFRMTFEDYDAVKTNYAYVASVDGQLYETLTAALNAATDGQTVKLLKDCEESSLNAKAANVTLDMNGHKLTNTSGYTINQWSGTGTLNIKGSANSVISGTVRVSSTLTFTDDFAGTVAGTIQRDGGKLYINGGVFDGAFSNTSTTVTIVTIAGGSFKTKPTTSNSLKLAEGKTFEQNATTGYYDVVPLSAANAIVSATVGGETSYYMTLKEAQDAASAGGTIKLLKDFDYGSNSIEANYYPTGNVTLDLNGKTLSLGNYTNFIMLYSGTLTLTDSVGTGTIASNNSSTLLKAYNGANMVVNNITCTCNSGKITLIDYDTSATGSTTLTNVKLDQSISARGTVIYNNCNINAQVTVWGGSALTINGGSYGMLLIYSDATLNVSVGRIGYINKQSGGTVVIESCVIDTALYPNAYGADPSTPSFTGCTVVANGTDPISWTVTKTN